MDVTEFITVTVYGSIIMLLFTKENKTMPKLFGLIFVLILSGLFNLFIMQKLNSNLNYMLYPLTVHLPLLIYFVFVIKTKITESLFALTAAYMLTTPRKWLIVLICYFLKGNLILSIITKISVSVILLIIIANFFAPVVVKILKFNQKETDYLCLLPTFIYILSYVCGVYSDFMFNYPMVSIPVLTTVSSVFFIVFEICFFEYFSEKINFRHKNQLLNLQIKSVKKLAGHLKKSTNYFCENETLNAFLSTYETIAKSKNILFICDCNLSQNTSIDDVCVILVSCLDDCLAVAKKQMEFEAVEKKEQICLMIKTDGECVYGAEMLQTLKSVAEKNKGFVLTDKEIYKIQILIPKKIKYC